MMKLAILLLSFGPAIFFESSIIWSVVERCSQKSFDAISEFFDQSENKQIRELWRSYTFQYKLTEYQTATEPLTTPEYVPTSKLRHCRSINDAPLEISLGPADMVRIF
jgi:hypothetical protein